MYGVGVASFSIWPAFGFRENPYDNAGLPGNDQGNRLLVGRDTEVGRVQRALASGGIYPSVEGPAGTGKTSMLAVAGYRMMLDSIEAKSGTLYVPARPFFQAGESAAEFEEQVVRAVAQTLIDNVEAFRQGALEVPDVGGLDKWLNDPNYRSGQMSVASLGGGGGSSPNTGVGFAESGFPEKVRAELERCFPTPGSGAVVCVLDNLELLQTSANARATLEALRDPVFKMPGLRWVLCGARGIVSRARSERLSGVFAAPMQLAPLSDEASVDLIRRRIDFFGGDGAYPPVPPEAFEFLYRALNFNLRDALAHAQQFSDWMYEEFIVPDKNLPRDLERRQYLESWLTELAERAEAAATGVPKRAWQFFDQLAQAGGRCGAGEYEAYGFNTQQQMGGATTTLVSANIVIRETDPENAARNIHSVTPVGWLVYFKRNGFQAPER
jgi:hypothetical protein